MTRKCTRFGATAGWERFLNYADFYTWDYVIEAGIGDPTQEEEEAILNLGYYGKKITPASITAIAQRLKWKPEGKYVITMNCIDGADEKNFNNLETVAEYVRARLGDSQRNVTQDGFGTDYCNFHFHGFTMADLGINILQSSGFGRCHCR